MSEPERLGAVLGRSNLPRPKKRGKQLELLSARWEEIAGPRLAEHCRPSAIARGTLTVTADGASWASEVSASAGAILRGVERELPEGAVKRTKVRARAVAKTEKGEPAPAEEEVTEPPEELLEIKDERLREAVHRMLKASKASKQNEQKGA